MAGVGLAATRYSPMAMGHHLAVADVAARLLDRYRASQAGVEWRTERELRRDAMTRVRDRGVGGLLRGVPHVPDGCLVFSTSSSTSDVGADGSKAQRVAVEVELAPKTQAEYGRIRRGYAAAFDYDAVRWFVAPDAAREGLAALTHRHGLGDAKAAQPLPAGIPIRTWC